MNYQATIIPMDADHNVNMDGVRKDISVTGNGYWPAARKLETEYRLKPTDMVHLHNTDTDDSCAIILGTIPASVC